MSIEFTALDAENFVRPLTGLSHINVPLNPRALILRASVLKRWLDDNG